jgi:hypothetical protein
MPDWPDFGRLYLEIFNPNTGTSIGEVTITTSAPGIFSANGDGLGPLAGFAIHVRDDDSRLVESLAVFDEVAERFVNAPIVLSATSRTFLTLFGTGFGKSFSSTKFKVEIRETPITVQFVGPEGNFHGLEKIELGPIPLALAGVGPSAIDFSTPSRVIRGLTISLAGLEPPPLTNSLSHAESGTPALDVSGLATGQGDEAPPQQTPVN